MFTLGLDFHGVLDKYPEIFGPLSQKILANEGKVYVITGSKVTPALIQSLKDLKIEYTEILSIVDYHIRIGTIVTYDSIGDPWLDNMVWDTTKAKFCEEYNVDLHIDDSKTYGQYFTGKTHYLLWK